MLFIPYEQSFTLHKICTSSIIHFFYIATRKKKIKLKFDHHTVGLG